MKSFIKMLVGIALFAYLVFAVVKWSRKEDTDACKNVRIAIVDSTRAAFITEADVRTILEKKHLYPEGLPMNRINLLEIESTLEKHPFILDAQCYKTPGGVVHVNVSQRLPVMRIMSVNGNNYFIDGRGKKLSFVSYPADVVVATGAITPKYAQKFLAPVGRYLQTNDFWNSQIEQLNVLKDGTLEMVPRVGNHIIYLGSPTKIDKKLDRLKLFYRKVLCRVGWNKYSRIDLQFGNQIVCTKNE